MTAPPSCFVTTIDLALANKLRQDLENQGFILETPPHTLFSAKKKGISCTLYNSGKLTVQGKDKTDFIAFYLEPEILHNLSYTHPVSLVDPTPRAGQDEAGKGDFFGALCVAAIYVGEAKMDELLSLGVKDSKQLSDETVLAISYKLKKAFPHKVIRLFPETYNRLYAKFHNLNRLLGWAHASALEELIQQTGCQKAILDQFAPKELMVSFLKQKNLNIDLVQRVRGEEDPVVAAASILARAAFLESIQQLSDQIDMPLPKGASLQVIEAGKKAVRKYGSEILNKIGKTHFKTMESILS